MTPPLDKSIQQRQIAASTYHAAEAVALIGEADTPGVSVSLDTLVHALVHATLSQAAATRALVTL